MAGGRGGEGEVRGHGGGQGGEGEVMVVVYIDKWLSLMSPPSLPTVATVPQQLNIRRNTCREAHMREGYSSLPKAEGSRRLCLHDMQELMYMYHIPSANPVRLGREGGREGGREREVGGGGGEREDKGERAAS